MKKEYLSICFLMLFLASAVYGRESDSSNVEDERLKYNIGFGAGFATGYGLSFRYMPSKFGAQVNFGPYVDEETTRISSGLTFIFNLVETKNTTLFLYQANHYFYDSYIGYDYPAPDPNDPGKEPGPPAETQVTEQYFNNGIGFGVEVTIVKRLGLNFMAGYGFYENFRRLNITGETALYYKF